MNFDWYQGTLDVSSLNVSDVVKSLLSANDLSSSTRIRGINNYDCGVEISRGPNVFSRLFWSSNLTDGIHFITSGHSARTQTPIIRKLWPDHRVSRADVAEDYCEPGAFEKLVDVALKIADEFNVKVNHQGDWHRAIEGRTLYVGSRASVAQLCVYEKGKQLGRDPDWARVELRVRPQSRSKRVLASMSPPDMYGCSRWSTALYELLTGIDVDRVQIGAVHTHTDLTRAYTALLRQYGNTLDKIAGAIGGYDLLGSVLRNDLKSLREGQELEALEALSVSPTLPN